MLSVISCIQDDHVLLNVVAALLICTVGSLSAGLILHRGRVSRKTTRRRIWGALAGAVMGLGIWGTHFMAMLGYKTGMDIRFDGTVTVLSFLIVVVGLAATAVVLLHSSRVKNLVLGGMLATVSISSMHFYGITALKPSAIIEHDLRYVVVAIISCGLLFAIAGIVNVRGKTIRHYMFSSVFVLAAIICLHFISMTGMTAIPIYDPNPSSWLVSNSMMEISIVVAMIVILIVASLAAGFDSVFSRMQSQERQRLSILADAVSEAIFVADETLRIVEMNANAERLIGRSRRECMGKCLGKVIGLTRDDIPKDNARNVLTEHVLEVDETSIPVDVELRSMTVGRKTMVVASLRDLRERLAREKHIRNLAFRDQLTHLGNRTSYQRALNRIIRTGWPAGTEVAVLLIDLDEFKDINDQFGHAAGDAVLNEVAARMKSIFGPEDVLARLGGDEFAVLMRTSSGRETVISRAQSCVDAMKNGVTVHGITMHCGISMGISFADRQGESVERLLKSADRALYAAKEDGRGCLRVYDADLHEQNERRRDLEVAMAQAIQEDEFELFYQPKVTTETREVLGYEALIRWHRPGHGMVMPGEFIAVAEQSKLIQDIGRWSIYRACKDAASWPAHLSVSVNLSARQFLDPELNATIRDALRRSGLAANRLELEITETALIQNMQVAAETLGRLSLLGVKIALDDFGTGYSSMRFIQQLPFDRIKIDRSFVAMMESDTKAYAIVDAILRLGQNLSIPVVAEGVETEAQAKYLYDAKCTELQGYLIGRPQPLSSYNITISNKRLTA